MAEDEVRPASPLPFRVGKRQKAREDLTLIDDDDGEVGDFAAVELEEQDWEYVAHAANEYPRLRERVRELEAALPDPAKLETLASFFDLVDKHSIRRDEAQRDLRRWANAARKALEAKDADA